MFLKMWSLRDRTKGAYPTRQVTIGKLFQGSFCLSSSRNSLFTVKYVKIATILTLRRGSQAFTFRLFSWVDPFFPLWLLRDRFSRWKSNARGDRCRVFLCASFTSVCAKIVREEEKMYISIVLSWVGLPQGGLFSKFSFSLGHFYDLRWNGWNSHGSKRVWHLDMRKVVFKARRKLIYFMQLYLKERLRDFN